MLQQIQWKNSPWLVFSLLAFCLFFRLGSAPVYILDEARNAQCAWEMKQKNNYVVPLFNDKLRSEKPPLHYYFMALAYKVFGKNAFAARFFSAVCGLLTLLMIYLFTKRFLNRRVALYATSVSGLSVHFLFEFRLAVPDPYLILFQAVTLFSLFTFSERKHITWLYAAGVFAALSTLAKGPVAIALPALIFIVYLATCRQLKLLLNWHWLGCLILYLVIAAPWFFLVHKATGGEFSRLFFLRENLNRFSAAMEGHNNWPGLPLLIVIVGLLPASVLLFSRWQLFRDLWADRFLRFALIVCAVVLLFYSFSATLLPNYPMVCYPFMSIILAYLLGRVVLERPYLVTLSVIYAVFAIAGFLALQAEKEIEESSSYWALIFVLPLLLLLTAAFSGKKKQRYAFLLGGFILFNALALGFAYPAVYKQNPVTKNLSLLNKQSRLGSFGLYNPAVNFYINGPVKMLPDTASILSFLYRDNNAVLVGRKSDLNKLDNLPVKLVAEGKDLFETPTTVFLVASESQFHYVEPRE